MSAHALQRNRSIWKSSNTNSIGAGKCNPNITMPEELRDLIDSVKGDRSRNAFFMDAVIDFLKRNNPAAHVKAMSILQLHQVMKSAACVIALGLLGAAFLCTVLDKKSGNDVCRARGRRPRVEEEVEGVTA